MMLDMMLIHDPEMSRILKDGLLLFRWLFLEAVSRIEAALVRLVPLLLKDRSLVLGSRCGLFLINTLVDEW